jgi:hypothetical protein
MADTVFVLNFRCLGSLACKAYWQSTCDSDMGFPSLPAPGGPIKIIRIDCEGVLEFVPSPPSRSSSCRTRVSSFATRSFRSVTVSSLIGAMLRKGVGEKEAEKCDSVEQMRVREWREGP